MANKIVLKQCQLCDRRACTDILCKQCISELNRKNREHLAYLERLGGPMPDLNAPASVKWGKL